MAPSIALGFCGAKPWRILKSLRLKPRAFHFYLESDEMLYVFVFAAERMVKGAATLTRFALGKRS